MKKILIFTMLSVLPISTLRAQDSTRIQRYEYVLGSTLVFSFADYVGYNLVKKAAGAEAGGYFYIPPIFSISRVLVQSAITYFLYKECGLSSAISFNLIWWTWGDDLAYYGWGASTSLFPWESSSQSGLKPGNDITWAGWTPIGLLRKQGSVIDKYTLYAQAIVGFSVSMAIIW